MQAVEELDEAEYREGDDQEVDDGGQEGAVPDGDLRGGINGTIGAGNRGFQHDFPVGKVHAAGKHGDGGHNNVVDQGGGDFSKRAADDNADSHVHHIAPGNELFKFRNKTSIFCHKRKSFL